MTDDRSPNTVLTFIFMEQLQKLVKITEDLGSSKRLEAAGPGQKA